MPNLSRLGKGAVRKIHNAIEELFDRAKARLLGPQSIQGKKIYIGFQRELSLPGVFEAGSLEEAVKPDLEVLESLIKVASSYVDAHCERTKARIVHEINGSIAEAKHNGGMSQGDFRDLVNTKLSSVWEDVTRNIHSIVDTEIAHAKNVSVLDGIIGANANASVDDPVVYFVVVRDNILCDECKRLHLLDDEVTPRLWYLSELGHGYHKKGQSNPKIGGLHPHCRCTLVTLLPSYGFTKDGRVKYVKRGHLEIEEQRGLRRSEQPLMKSERGWDPSKHPRDPETGEFIDQDKAVRTSIKSRVTTWREYEGQEDKIKELVEHSRKVLKALKRENPEWYEEIVRKPWLADQVQLDDEGRVVYEEPEHEQEIGEDGLTEYERSLAPQSKEEQFYQDLNFARREIKTGHLKDDPASVEAWWNRWAGGWPQDRATQVEILRALGIRHLGLAKEEALRYEGDPSLYHTPIYDVGFSSKALAIRDQIQRDNQEFPQWSRGFLVPGLNSLMFGYKSHSNGLLGQLLKYIGHRLLNADDYKVSDLAKEQDENFEDAIRVLTRARAGSRGTQLGTNTRYSREVVHPVSVLAALSARNLHLYDEWTEHAHSLHEKICRENPGVSSLPFARAFKTPNPQKHRVFSSFSDSLKYARPEGGRGEIGKGKEVLFYDVPMDALQYALSLHHAGPATWGQQRGKHGAFTSEFEWILPPHNERRIPPLEAESRFREIYPHPTKGSSTVRHLIPNFPSGEPMRDLPKKIRRGIEFGAVQDVLTDAFGKQKDNA